MATDPRALPASPEGAFAAALAGNPSAPLLTFYDAASGERVELSARSLANWVAKTHHLLVDDLGLGPGDRAYAPLPPHWMSAPALLGSWSAGLSISDDGAGAAVAFVGPDDASAVASRPIKAPDVYAISFAALGRPFNPAPPAGTEDFVLAVRPMPDAWASVRPPAASPDPAWDERDGRSHSRADLVRLAADRGASLGLSPGGRLMCTGSAHWLDWLLAPLVAGCSTVLVVHVASGAAGLESLERIAQSERVTARVG